MMLSRSPLTFLLAVAMALSLATSPLFAAPEIEVYRDWDNLEVPNGNSFAFPHTDPGVWISRLFRIENNGTTDLILSNHLALVTGDGFTQIENPSDTVEPGQFTTFRVRFARGAAKVGMWFGEITINNNSSQSPYVIHLAGSAGTFPPPAQSMFVLETTNPAERDKWVPPQWTAYQGPPTCLVNDDAWFPAGAKEVTPLKYLWTSFCHGQAQGNPPSLAGVENRWFNPTGSGSQNHGPLWLGVAALGNALNGSATTYDQAAEQALQILALDLQPTGQGHMRHEAVSKYVGFWEGGVAAMALAGMHQPQGATRGAELLAAARNWWRDHVGVLRQLRMPDGQVALVGPRLGGFPGYIDHQSTMTAAVNLQLLERRLPTPPLAHSQLHPWLQTMIDGNGNPGNGFTGPNASVNWRLPREVAQRWIVLRAIQLGALEPVPTGYPVRCLSHHNLQGSSEPVWRWQVGSGSSQVIHTALEWVYGLGESNGGVRWHMSWRQVGSYPGKVLQVEVGTNGQGYPGKGPHSPYPPDPPVVLPGYETAVIPGCP